MPIALLASYVKDDPLLTFARELSERGWEPPLASRGTAEFLNAHKIAARDVAEIVGPPILDHRVVTLSRELFAALLANPDDPSDMAELERIGVKPVDLVYVSLYPLQEALDKPDRTRASVLKNVDIGGVALLRAAAKGGRIVLSNPDQFDEALRFLKQSVMGPNELRRWLARFAAEAEETAENYAKLTKKYYELVCNDEFDD